ncbi:MAG: Ig-like domain-containing protein [Candidatus Electryonea clarkiae]|nr:Ig-like domain-containing protein [Candidatus Electryonea clarkiae]MDP8288135.1 Ig-like domain-containing protein [Candidatus Electryonea clarkiae]
MKNQIRFLVIAVFFIAFCFSGCTGSDGPAGQDAVGIDTTPPVISLALPVPNDTLNDTLTALANAIDNVGIERVAFYLDGSDLVNDTTVAWVTAQPYKYEYALSQMNLSIGQHTIAARAYDIAQNTAITPTVIFYYGGPRTTGTAVLQNYNSSNNSTTPWSFVEHHTVMHDTVELDSISFLKFAVRFTPAAPCLLQYVSIQLDTISNDTLRQKGLVCSIYSSDGAFPLVVMSDSTDRRETLPDSAYVYNAYFPDSLNFDRGQDFHLIFEIFEPDTTIKMTIRTEIKPLYDGPEYHLPFNNFSAVWDNESGEWVTFQEKYGEGAYEFHAKAVVEY